MSIIHSMRSRAGRVAGDVRKSVVRARLEGERRLLERRHRTALEALGARAYDLVKEGALPGGALAAEVAEVDARVAEIEAKAQEVARDESDVIPGAEPGTHRDAGVAFPILREGADEDDSPG